MVFLGSLLYILAYLATDIAYTSSIRACGWPEAAPMPKFVFLWTDLVLWLVVATVVAYVVHVRRSLNLRTTWRHVLRDAPAMSAAVVLLVFITIALLDSIHFRPRLPVAPDSPANAPAAFGTRTLSPLDVLLRHATEAREKTYSVPLAYWVSSARPPWSTAGKSANCRGWRTAARTCQDPAREWKPDLIARSLRASRAD